MIGFLNVNKPAGPTSHDIVADARRRLPRKTKVGHCGTLDPFAEGVLVLCVGAATRLAHFVQRQPKRYSAQVTLGASSSTDDPTGAITPWHGRLGHEQGRDTPATHGQDAHATPPTAEQVRACVARFVGEIRQSPPAHSAVHIEGQRAYEFARRGEAVEMPERTVNVFAIDIVRYEYPLLELDVRCGGGTYIRALARDVGTALGTGAYCSRLTRTEVGVFHAADAVRAEELDPVKHLLSPVTALEGVDRFTLSEADCARVAMGQSITIRNEGTRPKPGECALLNATGELIAIAEHDSQSGAVRPRIVLKTE